jgi:zinc protease
MKRYLQVQKSIPQSIASEKFYSILYKDHAYGRTFPTEKMIDSYTIGKVKGFYDTNFGAKRAVLYAVGKFNEAAVSKVIEETLGNWKEGPEVDYPAAVALQTSEIALIDRPHSPQSTIMLGLSTLTPSDPDFIALQVTNSLLGGSISSRIARNLREDKGYTYNPFSSVQNFNKTSVWIQEADVTGEYTGASLQEIAKEIQGLQNQVPPKEELLGTQRFEAGLFVLRNSSPNGIINQLNFIEGHGLSDRYLTDRVKNIYAVSPEKIQQMIKDHFNYEKMTLVIVGDKKLLEKQMKSYEAARKVK